MVEASYGPVVTISASYGQGGSVIAPRLAELLGVPFVDRMIAADELRSQEGLGQGERETTPSGRFLTYFARAASVGTVIAPDPDIDDDDSIRQRAEAPLRRLEQGSPGVVLGRAGAVVLASRPRAFHVRLDGPVDRRISWAESWEGLERAAAAKHQAEADKARTLYVKRLYRRDPTDPTLYHLMVDTTVLGVEGAIRVINTATEAFFSA